MNGRAAKLCRRVARKSDRPLRVVKREWRNGTARERAQARRRLGLTDTEKRLRIEKIARRRSRFYERLREAQHAYVRAGEALLFSAITGRL